MTADRIRTHVRNNQRHTLVLKSRQFLSAVQALDHSATVTMYLKTSMLTLTGCTEVRTVTLWFRCSRCVGNEFVRLLINIFYLSVKLLVDLISLYKIQHDFFSMLQSSDQTDANCSRSTNASKLVIDFLDEPLEKKKTMTPKSFACHHIKTLLVEINNLDSFKCGC